MTAKEFLAYQIDDAGYQLEKTFEDLAEADFDHHSCPSALSPREIVEHLAEAYQATISLSEGREHQWGSFVVGDKSSANLISVWKTLRAEAVEKVLGGEGEDALNNGHAYIVAHDYYHVGQMCTTRFSLDPNWNGYSIYRH